MSLKVIKYIKLIILVLSLLGCLTILKYCVSEVFVRTTSIKIQNELRNNIENIYRKLRPKENL